MRNVLLVTILGMLVAAEPALAAPFLWSDNGHYYELSDESLDWEDAKDDAEGLVYLGLPGHLASVTSLGENDFILDMLNADYDFFGSASVGGFQPAGSGEPAGGWSWVTGEPFVFTNWDFGEPNNFGEEDVLQMYASSGKWNDISGAFEDRYVIEYEGAGGGGGPVIPEPASLLLFGLGLGGAVGAGRVKRQPTRMQSVQSVQSMCQSV